MSVGFPDSSCIHVFPDIVVADERVSVENIPCFNNAMLLQITGNPLEDVNCLKCVSLKKPFPDVAESCWLEGTNAASVYLWAIGPWERLVSLAWFIHRTQLTEAGKVVMVVQSRHGIVLGRDAARTLASARLVAMKELSFFDMFWQMFSNPGTVGEVVDRLMACGPPSELCLAIVTSMQKLLPRVQSGCYNGSCYLDELILSSVCERRDPQVARVLLDVASTDADFGHFFVLKRIMALLDASALTICGDRIGHFPANRIRLSDSVAGILEGSLTDSLSVIHVPMLVGALTT